MKVEKSKYVILCFIGGYSYGTRTATCISLFQVLGSWGRGKRASERKKVRED